MRNITQFKFNFALFVVDCRSFCCQHIGLLAMSPLCFLKQYKKFEIQTFLKRSITPLANCLSVEDRHFWARLATMVPPGTPGSVSLPGRFAKLEIDRFSTFAKQTFSLLCLHLQGVGIDSSKKMMSSARQLTRKKLA